MPARGIFTRHLRGRNCVIAVPAFLYIHVKTNNMKEKNINEKQLGRRFREDVDGPEIEKRYATTPTPELARQRGLTVKQITNYVYKWNMKPWARKLRSLLSVTNSKNGKKGGRPRKKQ